MIQPNNDRKNNPKKAPISGALLLAERGVEFTGP
jgi:hypothetical protein